MPITLPNDVINQTPADAIPVQQNYEVIEQYINANVITRDGSVAMAAPLTLVGDPTQPLHAVPMQFVNAIMPVGVMLPYGGAVSPAGQWALANGASLPTSTYPLLFAVFGFRFGGSGSNFNLPNMAGRIPIGADPAQTDIATTGKTGGTTTPPLLQHQHKIDHDHGSVTSAANDVGHTHSISHDHAAFYTPSNTGTSGTAESGGHNHEAGFYNMPKGTGAGVFLATNSFDPLGDVLEGMITRNHQGQHTHIIDVPAFTGTSGAASATHTHAVDLPAYAGNSGNTVQAVDTSFRPPYVAINYIVRVG